MIEWKKDRQISKWAVLGGLLFFIAVIFTYSCMHSPQVRGVQTSSAQEKIYLRVKPGMTADDIGTLLQQHGVISSKYNFWLTAKLNGADSKFKTGNYALHRNMEAREVLRMLVDGATSSLRFTIPEGYNVREIAKRLSDEGLVDQKEFLRAAKTFAPYSYMKKSAQADYAAELTRLAPQPTRTLAERFVLADRAVQLQDHILENSDESLQSYLFRYWKPVMNLRLWH